MNEDCHDSNNLRWQRDRIYHCACGKPKRRDAVTCESCSPRPIRWSGLPKQIRDAATKQLRERGFMEPIHLNALSGHTHKPGEHCQSCENRFALETENDRTFLRSMRIKVDE